MADELAARRRVRGHLKPGARVPIQVANLTVQGLTLKDADVLVVHNVEDVAGEVLEQLHLVTGMMVLGLGTGQSIETLDEDAMRDAGWVRVDREGAAT